jgi:hypothetical protein
VLSIRLRDLCSDDDVSNEFEQKSHYSVNRYPVNIIYDGQASSARMSFYDDLDISFYLPVRFKFRLLCLLVSN